MGLPGISPAVFRFRHRTLIFFISPLVGVFSLTRILAGLRSGAPSLNWLAVLVLWLFLFLLALRRRLVLTEQGLEYTELFRTLHISWGQVVRLVSRRALGLWRAEGLEVWADTAPQRGLFIDLTQFSTTWRREAIGAILRAKVPHLFQLSEANEAAP
jgi:hypothetical protein